MVVETGNQGSGDHLADWFVGYEHAHGTYVTTASKNEKGKVEGKALTVKSAATLTSWNDHLDGTGPGIGIIALLEDNTVRWGAVDVDKYSLDLEGLSKKIGPLPLVMFRSKSGGAHLVCFVRQPIPADDMVEYLSLISSTLGFGTCEIFPKQTSRANERDTGNWLNMPYANAEQTMRYALHEGKALSLQEAVQLIQSKALEEEGFYQSLEESRNPAPAPLEEQGLDASGLFLDGPPCLQYLSTHGGFGPGVRNEGMFNVAVYLKKKDPDNWRDLLLDYRHMCNPPMDIKELSGTVEKSVSRKEYSYRCNQAPIAPHCNRRLCLKREFGIGELPERGSSAIIGALTKYEGNPVMWVIDIEGKRLELSTEELLSQGAFARKCAEVLTRVPSALPEQRWRKYLDDKMRTADIVAAPPDEEVTEGLFWVIVERFCVQRAQGTSRDAVLTNYPYTERGVTYFRGASLLDYLNRSGYRYKTTREVWRLLQDKGAKKEVWNVRGKEINVWGVDEFDQSLEEKNLPIMVKPEEF